MKRINYVPVAATAAVTAIQQKYLIMIFLLVLFVSCCCCCCDIDHADSRLNRCRWHPRCALFACCDGGLNDHDEEDGSVNLFDIVLTRSIVHRRLSLLKPTMINQFDELNNRSSFVVIYLVQGDYRQRLPAWYENLENMVYLSYKEQSPGNGLHAISIWC